MAHQRSEPPLDAITFQDAMAIIRTDLFAAYPMKLYEKPSDTLKLYAECCMDRGTGPRKLTDRTRYSEKLIRLACRRTREGHRRDFLPPIGDFDAHLTALDRERREQQQRREERAEAERMKREPRGPAPTWKPREIP